MKNDDEFIPTHLFTLSDGRRLPMVVNRNENAPDNDGTDQWHAFTRESVQEGYDPDAISDAPHNEWFWNYTDENVTVTSVEDMPDDLVRAAMAAAVDNADAWVNCYPNESFIDKEAFKTIHTETLDKYLHRASTAEERSLVWSFYMDETSNHVLDVLAENQEEENDAAASRVTPVVLRALVCAYMEAEPDTNDPLMREAFQFFTDYHREHPYSTSAIENTALEGVRWTAQALEAWIAR